MRSQPADRFALQRDIAAALGTQPSSVLLLFDGYEVFGLLDGEHLVGITGAFAWPDDISGETATLVMSYIVPAYRGRGLSGLLYTAALDWIRTHPRFRRVIVAFV